MDDIEVRAYILAGGPATLMAGDEHGPVRNSTAQGSERIARGPHSTVVTFIGSIQNLLLSQGYRLTDDAWEEDGRRTYIHDDGVAGSRIKSLSIALKSAGWKNSSEKLFSFVHRADKEIIEVEPGGPGVSGHFLHHMKQLSTRENKNGN